MWTVRPKEIFNEWGKEQSFGSCRMLPTQNKCHISIHGDFTKSTARELRKFAKWMERAAKYMEENNGK